MFVCPKCDTTYPEAGFCPLHGAKLVLVSGSEPESSEPSPESSSSKDELPSGSTELARLREDNERAQTMIAELEAKLDAAERELKTLKSAAAPAVPQAVKPEAVKPEAVKPEAVKPEAVKPATAKKTATAAPERGEPEATEVVVPPQVMHGWLIGVEGTLKGKEFGIPREGLKIGRAKRWQISIKDDRVSNPHAWVGPKGKDVVVRDQDSTNGTYLNDPDSKRIEEAVLTQGDVIFIGDSKLAALMFVKTR
jgi:FHA domain